MSNNLNFSTCTIKSFNCMMGHGGALAETPFDRRVMGLNPALATMYGPWASPSLAVACSALACKL